MNPSKVLVALAATLITALMLLGVRSGFRPIPIATNTAASISLAAVPPTI